MTGDERRERLARAQLYLCVGIRPDLPDFLDAVLAAGVDVVQLREKRADADRQIEAAAVFESAARRHGALFVVNDRADVAIAAGADGVHLGQEDPAPAEVRTLCGGEMLIGRSTHDAGQVREALAEQVDYLGVGPVHETPTKPGRRGVGLGPVRLAAAEVSAPWFVTGGMTSTTIPEAAAAGARRFVVVRAIADAPDPAAAVRELRTVVPPLPT